MKRALFVVMSLPLLLGCPNPNTYGTPRTVPAGKGQHTVAFDAIYARARTAKVDPSGATLPTTDDSGTLMLPTYQYRHGLTDTLDFAVRITNMSGLGGDVKWNFLRRSAADLAIDPGVQVVDASNQTAAVLFVYAPLLAGINVTEKITAVLAPGLVYTRALGKLDDEAANKRAILTSGGMLASFGLGVNFRTGRATSMMPEITAMRPFNASGGLVVVAGLGLKFGAQPP
jgi:hypothetical protein